MPFSEAIDCLILDHFTGKATWTAPAAIYMGLSSTTPTKTGTNVTEPTAGNYARVLITAAQFSSAATSATAINAEKAVAAASADWVSGADLTHIVFYTAITSGTFLGFRALADPKPVMNGDTAKFAATTGITITMGGT